MGKIIRVVRRPKCFGKMYELGENHMAENCLGCRFFKECSRIGGGVEAKVMSIPRELDTYGEVTTKW